MTLAGTPPERSGREFQVARYVAFTTAKKPFPLMPTLTAPPRHAPKGIAAAAILGVAALRFALGSATASPTVVPGSAPVGKVATRQHPSFCEHLAAAGQPPDTA